MAKRRGVSGLGYEKRVILKSIGFVKTPAVGDEIKDKSRLSEIFIDCELSQALEGISGFSHVFVLFWLHEITSKERETLKVHPRGRRDLPLLGVFATRTNLRPNPIGLTLCELVKVEGNVLTVRGLDAFDGTPVLDLKPYDSWDCAANARMPDWWMKLEKERTQKPLP
jgi:tRNA (adenine37-N6)-methyltransferase